MNIVKVRFINNAQPTGRAYTYYSKEKMAVGELVQINSQSKGIVTDVDIPEEEIESYKDKVKFIYGKAEEKAMALSEEAPVEENGGNE